MYNIKKTVNYIKVIIYNIKKTVNDIKVINLVSVSHHLPAFCVPLLILVSRE